MYKEQSKEEKPMIFKDTDIGKGSNNELDYLLDGPERDKVLEKYIKDGVGLKLIIKEGRNTWKLISLFTDEVQGIHHRCFGMQIGDIVFIRVIERFNSHISVSTEVIEDSYLEADDSEVGIWNIVRRVRDSKK